jgi:hypothetical protein
MNLQEPIEFSFILQTIGIIVGISLIGVFLVNNKKNLKNS